MVTLIKIILSVLFFSCLLDLPYGYFQLVRFVALMGFGILAYSSIEKGNNMEVIIYASLAILFQPLIKLPLGRQLWNVIDVIVGLGLIVSIFIRPSKQQL